MRRCEERHALHLSARMRYEAGWSDVAIENVSAHGMMLSSEQPPRPGSYVEIRRATALVIARIMWRQGHHFGVRSQDVIDLAMLTAKRIAAPRASAGAAIERRRTPRMRYEDARTLGMAMQGVFLLIVALCLAVLLVTAAYRAMSSPLDAVRRAMAPQVAGVMLFERAA